MQTADKRNKTHLEPVFRAPRYRLILPAGYPNLRDGLGRVQGLKEARKLEL